jgi:DNA-binding transcriptional LysR family regulator
VKPEIKDELHMDGLTPGRLRYLFEAVRLGGIRVAADSLNVAPSVVSRQIALLEKAVRMPLLETNRRGAKPTEAGEVLVTYYREYVAQEEALVSRLDSIHGLESGTVTLGAVQGFTDDLMRHALHKFNLNYPKITINLKFGGIDTILQWLEEDDVHLGLVYGAELDMDARWVKTLTAVEQPICVITVRDHPLTQLSKVTVPDLFPYPFALTPRSFGTRKIIERIEAHEGQRFKVALETDQLAAVMSFVRAGIGLTFAPAFSAQQDVERGILSALPIEHELMQHVSVELISRRGRALPLGALKLQRLLIENMRAFRV